jgi:hypothetical protein
MVYDIYYRGICNITSVKELARPRLNEDGVYAVDVRCRRLSSRTWSLDVHVPCRVDDFQMTRLGSDYTCSKRLFVHIDTPDAASDNRVRCIHFGWRLFDPLFRKIDEDSSGCCCVGPAH